MEGVKMTKIEYYNQYVKPNLKENDRPFNRQLYNNAKDMLHKDGLITDNQVRNWIYPNTRHFK